MCAHWTCVCGIGHQHRCVAVAQEQCRARCCLPTRLQVLYNPNDMEPHVALQIIEKIVRLMQVCFEIY